jgi:hypothetical protein
VKDKTRRNFKDMRPGETDAVLLAEIRRLAASLPTHPSGTDAFIALIVDDGKQTHLVSNTTSPEEVLHYLTAVVGRVALQDPKLYPMANPEDN